jgi:HK97 family phage portal protein
MKEGSVTEYVTEAGVIVHDRRHDRGLPPNGNTPFGSVGPDHLSPGRYVMYPEGGWHSEQWDGWPVEWQTPSSGPAWSGYGAGRQNSTFGRVATAMTCVDLNGRQLASFPVYGMAGETPFTLPDWSGSPEPELYESWPQFVQGAISSLLLRGEMFLMVTGRMVDGTIARFITVDPDTIDVEFIDGRRVYELAGQEVPSEDILQVRYQSMPGRLRGITPLEWVASSIVTSGSLERYAAGLAERGGVPWSVLKSRGNINAKQAEDAQARWVSASQRRDGAPAVLGNEWDLETLTLSPKDMALLELREYDERRITAAFGVPAYLVNVAMAGGLTYSNAESLFFQHWTSTLRPLANLVCAAWSRWLLPRGQRIEMNPDRYSQPPFAQRVTAWQQLASIVDPVTGQPAISVAEIRAAERLDPLDEATVDAPNLTGAQMGGEA